MDTFAADRARRSLATRITELEDVIFGTREGAYRDGLKPQLGALKKLVNLWGAAIVAALLATGLVNGNAAHVVGEFIKGFAGG